MLFFSKIIKICVLLFTPFLIFSQNNTNNDKERFIDNVRFGSGFGLSFGSGFFSTALSPSAIYDVNQTISLGIGYNLSVNTRKNIYSSVINGGRLIGLFNITPQLQGSTEYEQNYVIVNFKNSNTNNAKYWSPALFIGAGYTTGNITFGMHYNILYRENSIYLSPYVPFVRVFF